MDNETLLDVILKDLSKRSVIGLALEQIEAERGKYWLRNELMKTIKEVTK